MEDISGANDVLPDPLLDWSARMRSFASSRLLEVPGSMEIVGKAVKLVSPQRLRLTLMREGSVFSSPKTGFAPSYPRAIPELLCRVHPLIPVDFRAAKAPERKLKSHSVDVVVRLPSEKAVLESGAGPCRGSSSGHRFVAIHSKYGLQ
jgi:hypothetical protein